MPTPRRRAIGLSRATRMTLAGTALAALAALTLQGPAYADTANPFPNGAPGEALDYATSTFHDPWDFSQASDLNLDSGPQLNLVSPKIAPSTGLFSFAMTTAHKNGYFSLLWGGYPGAMPLGRDGSVTTNYINAGTYKHLRMRVYSDSVTPVNTSIVWYRQDGQKQGGGMSVHLYHGWNEYDFVLKNNNSKLGSAPWSGYIHGLRFALSVTKTVHIKVDYARLYAPSPASVLTWQAPDPSQPASLFWTEDGNMNIAAAQPSDSFVPTSSGAADIAAVCDPNAASLYYAKNNIGTKNQRFVSCTPAAATIGAASVDVSGYPASSTFLVVQNGAVVASIGMTPHPSPTVTAPSAAGCGTGGKQSAKPLTWTFPKKGSSRGVLKTGNVSYSYKGGALQGVNKGPVKNDPWVQLTLPKGGVAGKTWRYLSVTEGYTGPFNLVGKKGGTMGRVVWQVAGQSKKVASQTRDLVTYSGKQTLNIDMGQATAKLTEPEAKTRYPFAAAKNVTMLRWDPNENAGATRHWQLYGVTLGQACTVKAGQPYNVTWNDAGFTPGATAQVVAVKGSTQKVVASGVPELGVIGNSVKLTTASLGKGTWTIRVDVTNAAGTGSASSETPLVRK